MDLNGRLTQDQIYDVLKEVSTKLHFKNYRGALKILDDPLKANPEDKHLLMKLFEVYNKQWKSEKAEEPLKKAEEVLRKAHALHPEDSFFIGALSSNCIEQGKLDEASKLADEKIRLNERLNEREPEAEMRQRDNYRVAYGLKERIARKLGKKDEAEEWKNKKQQVERELFEFKGKKREQDIFVGKLEDIKTSFKKLNAQDVYDSAEELLNKYPKNPLLTWYQAKALMMMERYDEAEKVVARKYTDLIGQNQKLPEEDRNTRRVSVYLLKAQVDLAKGRTDAAKGWLDSVLEIDSKNQSAKGLQTSIALKENNFEKAGAMIDEMKSENNIYAVRHEAELNRKLGKHEEAIEGFYNFLKERPDTLVFKLLKAYAENHFIDIDRYNNFVTESVNIGKISDKYGEQVSAKGIIFKTPDIILHTDIIDVPNQLERGKSKLGSLQSFLQRADSKSAISR